MELTRNLVDSIKSSYIVVIIALLAIFAFVSAVLISWPALAYLGSKLFVAGFMAV